MEVIEGIAKVLMYGAKTYGPFNWREVRPYRVRYLSALFRHLYKRYWKRELFDKDTKLPHMFHAGCCLLFLADRDVRDIERLGLHHSKRPWHKEVDLFEEDLEDFEFKFEVSDE